MYYIYIIKSLNKGIYYIGSCNDILGRLERHNQGCVKSTKTAQPWELVHLEEYKTLSEARRREKQIKGWKSRAAIERLINKK